MAKKLALIDPDLLERLLKGTPPEKQYAPPPDPHLKAMGTLDTEMQAILNQKTMSPDQKVKLYNQLLQRYLTYEDKYFQHETPAVLAAAAAPAPTSPAGPQSSGDSWETEIVAAAPASMQKRARLLVDRIKSSQGRLGWNAQGELTVHGGSRIPGTNIVDLVNDVLRRRKGFNPKGWQQFAQGLRDVNVPQEVVGHQDRWTYMSRLLQNGFTDDGQSEASQHSSDEEGHSTRQAKKSRLTWTHL